MNRMTFMLALAIGFVCAACANVPEERRQWLRGLSTNAGAQGRSATEVVKDCIAILEGQPEDDDETTHAPQADDKQQRGRRIAMYAGSPTLRWQAANVIGELGARGDLEALAAYDLLFTLGLSAIADSNASVRRECIAALGKMPYSGPKDQKRCAVVERLRKRFLEDGEFSDQEFAETDVLVRMAMIDAIITLGMPFGYDFEQPMHGVKGYRDSAKQLINIVEQLNLERTRAQVDGRLHQGMIERALEGLAVITARTTEEAAAERARAQTLGDEIKWWRNLVDDKLKRLWEEDE